MEFTLTERGSRMVTPMFFKKRWPMVSSVTNVFLEERDSAKQKIKLSADDAFLNQLNEHIHHPSQSRVEATKIKTRIKGSAGNTNDTSQQILGAELRNVSEATAVPLPSLNNMRRNIRCQRDDHNMPAVPQRREDIPVLPNNYQVTNREDRFFLFDSGVGDVNRLIIFATHDAIRLLATKSNWFMDGTFKVCPEIFFKIYTIHVLINHQIFPCVFALLPNKTEITYNRFLTEVLNAVRNIGNELENVLVSFERAAMNAITNQLNQVEVNTLFQIYC